MRRVRFGGDHGQEFEISAGDVAILPAGTGHQCMSSSRDFCVVGAYPPGPPMDLARPTPESHAKALKTIPQVKVPKTDPVLGADGPLVRLWKHELAQSTSAARPPGDISIPRAGNAMLCVSPVRKSMT